MGKKAVKQDFILKGLDPNTAVIGPDGLWMAPPEVANYTEASLAEVAEVVVSEVVAKTPRNALVMPVESTKTEKPKTPKVKKPKEIKAVQSEVESSEQPAE